METFLFVGLNVIVMLIYIKLKQKLKRKFLVGVVAHDCNPRTLGGQGRLPEVGSWETSLTNMEKPHLY